MKPALIYSDKFGSFRYGADHPMRPVRLRVTYELMEAAGLLRGAEVVEARAATEKELLCFHTGEYLKILREANTGIIPVGAAGHGLGFGDNPVFRGVYDWSSLSAGASLQAAELVSSGKAPVAFNIAGGLHHAMPARASGFCYINDAVLAVKYLVARGKRVAYVDIDAHHGDGVEYAFYETDRVLTISIHESGQWLFPGTGLVTDTGLKQGKGFAVNIALPRYSGDSLFLRAFTGVVPPFIEAFGPDVLVTQLGVDSFASDPITHLNLTTNGFEEMVRAFRGFTLPWVALGGGGYNLGNVARGWSLAWAVMNGMGVPEKLPRAFFEANRDIFETDEMRDPPIEKKFVNKEELARLDEEIELVTKESLPRVSARP